MNLRSVLAGLFGRRRPAARSAAFPGAQLTQLAANWTIDPGSINRWLRYELRTLRARSRQLARGDAYAEKFLKACVDNIAGPRPFALQAKVMQSRVSPGADMLRLDVDANAQIELAWEISGRPGQFEITGRMSRAEVMRLLVRCIARDGEVIVRKLRGAQYGKAGLQLQVLDVDRLDEDKNAEGPGGAIKMGVQVDLAGRPVAYHLLKRNPGETGLWARAGEKEYEVIPAGDVFHLFRADWPEQVRGVPWMHAAMVRLYHLGGFEEAAVIAARVGAAQMGILEQDPEASAAAPMPTENKETGAPQVPQITVEPGTFGTLPYGWRMGQGWNPKYPEAAVEPFIRACLRGVAASLGVAYHSLANDPANVNYSTARVALLEERDMWMSMQDWFREHFCEPYYDEWRAMAALTGLLPSAAVSDRYASVRFQPKRWQWVDPQKEIEAKRTALELRVTSRTRIAAEQGEDIEDVLTELAQEEEIADSLGVELSAEPKPAPAAAPAAPAEADDGEDDNARRLRELAAQIDTLGSDLTYNLATAMSRETPAPVINVHPPEVKIEPAVINVTTPDVRVDAPITVNPAPVTINPGAVNVTTPDVRIDAPITVEPTNVHVTTPDVRVEPAVVNVAPASVTVEPTEVNVTTPDVRVEAPIVNLAPEIVARTELTVDVKKGATVREVIERDEEGFPTKTIERDAE